MVEKINFQENIYDTEDKSVDEQKGKKIRIKSVRFAVGEVAGKKILDVGCYDGEMISSFIKNNECYGLDISKKPLERAKKIGIKTSKLNFERDKFPFKNNFFDFIICSETLEHLIDQDHCLQEIRRVLKKDGKFILTLPNINNPVSWLIQIFLDYTPTMSARYRSCHFRDFSNRIIKAMLKINGFDVIKIKGLYLNPFTGRIARAITKIFPRFASTILYISKNNNNPKNLSKVIFDTRELVK